MKQFTLGQRLRYAFDNSMARGPIALIGWLMLASLVMIVFLAGIAELSPDKPEGIATDFGSLVWSSFNHTLDAGTLAGDTGGPAYVGTMLLVTLGGVFLVGALIGVLTAGVEGKIEDLRKGRSFVVENNHTVILGWSEQVFATISELVTANENQRRSCIVILADKDKVEMEDEIRDKVGKTGRTHIVCRTGSPIDMGDLDIVNIHGSRAIIVLAPPHDDPDSDVIKTVLAITNNPKRRPEPYHIVAEIHEHKNLEAAHIVGGDEAQIVETGDVISRVIVQTCRQSGLSVVYTELLDFGGDEIYFAEEPTLAGKTFGDTLTAFEDSCVIGIQFKTDQRVALNPPMNTPYSAGDKLIVIAEDDDKIKLSGLTDLKINAQAIQTKPASQPQPERTLILGWNHHGPTIVRELDRYVAPSSVITLIADETITATDLPETTNATVHTEVADTTDRLVLEAAEVQTYDHVIVLCYSDKLDAQRADARTLVTLLHLRNIVTKHKTHISIVSEMLDVRNRELAEVTHADDFIVSDKLISLMLAQIAENRFLNAVFTDIFDPDGSEIYLKPASDFVTLSQPVNFYTVVESARRRNQVAIGYRIAAHSSDGTKGYGVVVNPDKSASITFGPNDRVVVIAED